LPLLFFAAVTFVNALLNAHPQALVTSVRDIIPAMDGEALADPESWSGEWVETYWSPLTRARDRGLAGLVTLFRQFQQRHGIVDPTEKTVPQSSAPVSNISPGSRQVADVRFNENNASLDSINFNAAKPVKTQPLYASAAPAPISGADNYSGVNPIRGASSNPPHVGVGVRGAGSTTSGDDYVEGYAGHSASEDEGVNIVNRTTRLGKPSAAAPAVKIPPHILKAQQNARSNSSNGSQSGDSRGPSRERGGPEERQQQAVLQQQYMRQQQLQEGSLHMESVGEMPSYLSQGRDRDVTPLRQGMGQLGAVPGGNGSFNPNASTGSARSQVSLGGPSKAPPAGPIPASLLQAAENNAARLGKGTPGITAAQLQAINDAARASKRPQHVGPASPSNQAKNKGARSPRSPKGGNGGSHSPKNSFLTGDSSGKIGLSATTGRGLPNTRNISGSGNNNSSDNLEAEARVGTAPILGGKKPRADGEVVGFGSRSAWSNGEETAEDSTRPEDSNNVANSTQQKAVAPAALTAKQQRLLQAQQAYMKRATGVTGTTAAPDALPSGVNTAKPGPSPSSGMHFKAAPSNHTSDILKGMGGKLRVHPLAGSNNVRVVPVGMGHNTVDEMV
jgi:hypothetical protein